MGAGMLRCGRSAAIGLLKIISAGDGSPVFGQSRAQVQQCELFCLHRF